ncbi:MAG: sulfite exporter TauE/SafE family protein [Candidatus Thermoplasmatota archaeon]|jgi:cytochrome c-type biogenesis protein|nr:sulfite exporter TauE/SafE family protein [Candidatus Thermoplasmatota archaeon]
MATALKIRSYVLLTFLLFLCIVPFIGFAGSSEFTQAPDFTAIDENGITFSLQEYRGSVVLLHITGVETPLCIECLEEMEGQIKELEILAHSPTNVTIITLNIRKNQYSESGLDMVEQEFHVNVTWHWVEEFSPYPVAGLYQEYWTVDGAFSNPTILLIDANQSIIEVYHVYCLGKGKLDGVQSAMSLTQDSDDIRAGNIERFRGGEQDESITFLGMFALGILTALSPCSVALLVAMISYVGSLQKQNETSSKKYSLEGFWIGVIFTLGMSLVFFVFGIIISSIGFFIEVSTIFYLVAGIILIVLGVNVFKPLREFIKRKSSQNAEQNITERGQRLFLRLSKKSIYLGAFFLGILFSIGWAPCALSLMMPVFILTLTQKISIILGGLLLFVFGLGHGVPIIPLCAATSSIRGKLGNKYVTAGKWMQRVFGIIIVVIGLIMTLRFWGFVLW